ncbi:MAG TPA: hypothetical protein VKE70_31025, partial [Candidatus Solibacter sp.]|nr:hypothetical protein [Candidatus Solibacter sp.]
MFARSVLACAVLCCAAQQTPLEQTPRWRMQYFYDELKSNLVFRDIQFTSAKRGVAVGVIVEGKSVKPVSVTTDDGGGHWRLAPL